MNTVRYRGQVGPNSAFVYSHAGLLTSKQYSDQCDSLLKKDRFKPKREKPHTYYKIAFLEMTRKCEL